MNLTADADRRHALNKTWCPPCSAIWHPYAGTGCPTGTTTYAYDNNGNLISSGNGTATTTYTYDYANHPTAIFANNSTTTFGYDAFGARVYQIASTTATSTYPFKWYSIASTTKGSTNYATTTEYIFNGDTLISTVDQGFKNGAATGTAAVRYVHPDHLGSTDVVTDANQNLVQTLSYYPYGATRISNSTSTNEKRKFIGQFSDDSGLTYLNARYYSSDRGQFISEDPSFLAVGDRALVKQVTGQDQEIFLSDPQQMNSSSYGRDNPIKNKDPQGLVGVEAGFATPAGFILGFAGQGLKDLRAGRLSPFEDYVGSEVGTAVALNMALDTDGIAAAAAPGVGAAYGEVTAQVLKNLDQKQKGYSPSSILGSAVTATVFGYLFPDLNVAPVNSLLSYGEREYGAAAAGTYSQLNSALRATTATIFAQVARGSSSTGAQGIYSGGGGLAGIQRTLTGILTTINSLIASQSNSSNSSKKTQ